MNDLTRNLFLSKWQETKYSNFVPGALLFIATYLFLEKFNSYHFYYIEQFQLFLTTYSYFVDSISHPGGMMEYLARFLVQFFIIPHVGSLTVSLIILFIFHLSNKLLIKLGNRKWFFIAPVSIYLFCLFLCFDFNYYLQGLSSYLLCIWYLYIVTTKRESKRKSVIILLSIPLLYWIIGSTSILFAVCYMLCGIFGKRAGKKNSYWLFFPVFASFISWLGVRWAFLGEYRMSFLPDMYYQQKFNPSIIIYLPWILLTFWIIFARLAKNIIKKQNKPYLLFSFQCLLILFLLFFGIEKYGYRESYDLKKIDYYARKGQWNNIIGMVEGETINNYLVLNYLNLALAKNGTLSEKMFSFNQRGISGLKTPPKDIGMISPLMSEISLYVGDIASCQRYAFEGYESSSGGGSGLMLKRLVQTNLIYGEYAVTEKYINILEHTTLYKKWAGNQRRFLYQDSICAADSFICAKRRCLPPADSRMLVPDFPDMLETLVKIYPANEPARQYLLAYFLLNKDVKKFATYLLWYRQKNRITEIPEIYQQALLVFYETRPEQWIKAGIEEKTTRQYRTYKNLLLNNIRNKDVGKIMNNNFGSTYWFYLQFGRI